MQVPRRRVALFSAAVTAGAFAVLPQLASANLLAPDPAASDGVSSARTIYVVMAVLGVLIVVGVLGALLRVLRSSPGSDETGGEPARRTRGSGSVQKRVAAALGAFALVLFVVGIIFTEQTTKVDASTTGADPITIKVDGQQWLWRYAYPAPAPTSDGFAADAAYSYWELVIPVDTPINLEIGSTDVLHRWSVPALAPAADAVPGITNEVSFVATKTGTYEGASTRFSGPGYATMRTVVKVVEPAEYEAFLKAQVEGIKAARAAVQKRVADGTAPGVMFEQ